MRTLFSCHELALQIEGFDTHHYHVNERVNVRYRDRWVSLVVESVTQSDLMREICMRPLLPQESLQKACVTRIAKAATQVDPAWVDAFCDAIDGAKGPVLWGMRPPSH
jgi:hypothetical protein